MFGLTSLVQTFCVHRDKSVLKMRLTLFVLFWLEGGRAEVWQATLLSFLSHSTAAKKPKYRDMFSQFASDFRVKVVTSEFRTEGGDIA